MVDEKTSLNTLFKGTVLEKYAKYFYYGWDTSDDYQLSAYYPDIWPNEDILNSLNLLLQLKQDNKLDFIFFDNDKKDINFIYLKQNKKAKVAIVAAGGGYTSVCTAVESLPVGVELYKKGYNVFLLTYSINENAKELGAINDLNNGIKYLNEHQKELNIDLTDYIIGGFSAGGNLVATLLTDNHGFETFNTPCPTLVFLAYPVITFGILTHGGSRNVILGPNPSKEKIDEYSIENHISDKAPKVYVWQCERDNTVPIENTKLLVKALQNKNIPYIYKTYDSDAHGWGVATGKPAEGWINEMLEFIKD